MLLNSFFEGRENAGADVEIFHEDRFDVNLIRVGKCTAIMKIQVIVL